MKARHSSIVVGLGFGDEGKGTMTDFLVRRTGATLVVRYNGGPQAAHNVVMDDGRHHTFQQIGSGSFVPGTTTLLSRYMMWDPFALAHEAALLSPKIGEHALNNHLIDSRAPVITPFHIAVNRLKERARSSPHGSCGRGVGELAYDLVNHPAEVITAEDLRDPTKTLAVLKLIQERKRRELISTHFDDPSLSEWVRILHDDTHPDYLTQVYESISAEFNIVGRQWANHLMRTEVSVFEGAQGVLLDEWAGFHPYTTWSRVIPTNAVDLLKEAGFTGKTEVVGVVRAYGTRHGAGPFVAEEVEEMKTVHPQEHNCQDTWQGNFRVGAFDAVALRYAIRCLTIAGVRPDSLAVTHLDVFQRFGNIPYCNSYLTDGKVGPVAEAIDDGKKAVILNLTPKERDLDHQAKMAEVLSRSKPIFEDYLRDDEEAISLVQRETGIPVRYGSWGPTPSRKKQPTDHLILIR